MDEIVNKLYGTTSRERSINELIPGVNSVIRKLESWLSALPPSLQLDNDVGRQGPGRACLVLHMMYNQVLCLCIDFLNTFADICQLLILCTRPLLFIAVKHAVAAGYIPRKAMTSSSNLASAKCCAEAARRNSWLCRQLLASNQVSSFATLDYHYAFTAAVATLLVRLVPEITMPIDEENVSFLSHYLLKSADQGNESARDCAKMVGEFDAVVSRLLVDYGKPSTMIFQAMPNNDVASQVIIGRLPDSPSTVNGNDIPPIIQWDEFDSNVLPEGQLVAYQELFSWFQENPV
jgi:hypothetical protein